MLLSELISDRFQGTVNVRRDDTVDVKNVTMACGSWDVARQFSGWAPASLGVGRPFLCHETCLVQASSDFVAGFVKARVESSVPRHVGLLFHVLQARGQRVPGIKKLEQANIGRDASGCQCRLIVVWAQKMMLHGIRPASQRVPVIKIVKATTTQVLN